MKPVELKNWTPDIAAKAAQARCNRLRRNLEEFQRDLSILYEDVDRAIPLLALDIIDLFEPKICQMEEYIAEAKLEGKTL